MIIDPVPFLGIYSKMITRQSTLRHTCKMFKAAKIMKITGKMIPSVSINGLIKSPHTSYNGILRN